MRIQTWNVSIPSHSIVEEHTRANLKVDFRSHHPSRLLLLLVTVITFIYKEELITITDLQLRQKYF